MRLRPIAAVLLCGLTLTACGDSAPPAPSIQSIADRLGCTPAEQQDGSALCSRPGAGQKFLIKMFSDDTARDQYAIGALRTSGATVTGPSWIVLAANRDSAVNAQGLIGGTVESK